MLHYIFALFVVLSSHSSIFTAFAQARYKSRHLDKEKSSRYSRNDEDDRRREYQERRERENRLEELRREEEKRKEQRQKEIEYRQELERRREVERQRNEAYCSNTIDKEEEEYRKRREEEYEERQRQEELEKKDQEERDKRYWEEREEFEKIQRKIEQEKEQQRIRLEQILAEEAAKSVQATTTTSPTSENIPTENDSPKLLDNQANNNSSTSNLVIDAPMDDDKEIEKSKYKKLIKKSFIKGLSSELLAYDIYIDTPPSCVYIPAENDNPAYIYVPSFNDNPSYVYVPAYNGNQACIYVASQEDKEKLILASIPTILLGGGTIGGGFLSGGTIPIVVGGGILLGEGIKEIVRFLKNKKEKKNNSGGGGGGDNNNNKKNDDDDEEKKRKQKEAEKFKIEHPNGEYENNPKHHINARGKASKGPSNGQKALDGAVDVEGTKYKVGTEGQNIIVFQQHLPGKWHGYIVENPNDEVRNTLFNQGWIRATNNLKIIRK